MAELKIGDFSNVLMRRLEKRAETFGRSVEDEARALLERALVNTEDAWLLADEIRDKLAQSGRKFSDSAELIREDRER